MGLSKWGSSVGFQLPFPGSQAHPKPYCHLQWDLVHRGPQTCPGLCMSQGCLGEKAIFLAGRALLPSFPSSHPLTQSTRKSKFLLVTGTLDMIGKEINHDLFLHVRAEWNSTDHLVQFPFYSKQQTEVHEGGGLKDMGSAPANSYISWSKAQVAHCIGEEAESSRGKLTGEGRQYLSSGLLD